ncbi:MAG: transaldolase / glucose-6-phosphate isomerase [Thermoleophilaceae bacterium]|jgi:transaldolase/glucose-6-phosphate isomerase|nr:transaldolase / glucose-6-phosphate isomerase [Thermoleophilaceae bacterium]
MSVGADVNERLAALTAAGTSVWLDQIQRSLITSGELERLVREDSLRGVTSNPAIFEKAILGSTDYDEQVAELAAKGLDARQIYEEIAITDVGLACDVLRGVWDAAGGADGFVSLEVEPAFAHETETTLAQARDFWKRVGRPNLMIKIPGTEEGVPAIEEAVAQGINVNVTLLFSVESYTTVAEAYIRGMERRHAAGESLDVHSVASFFVSRVDTEVDKRLADLGREDLRGIAAVANARAAYMKFKELFAGERFAALREAGCPVQRPLWASTGVKDPRYPETKYVESLVGPHTVNTMPMPTLLACEEQLEVTGPTADQDPSADLQALAEAGIDMADVTKTLLRDGIEKFVEPFDKLIAGVEQTREAIVTGRPPTIQASIPDELEPPLIERVKQALDEGVARRIWQRDESLWGGPGVPEIANRLGWLTISEKMLEHAPELNDFVEQVKADGFTDAVLLGMGGSSLGPEVIRQSYGEIPGGLRLQVLDSTDPGAVLDVERSVDLERTLFIVSSKSGGTIETLSHMRYFFERSGGDGSRFVAITDPGSALVDIAAERGFRHVFENDPDIGGRYSVLSYFGLVPAALAGVNIEAMLHRAQVAEQNCAQFGDIASNSGLWLGIALGQLALLGRDKATFVVSDPISSFGLWVEQLIAESTGKHGKGILPVAGEPLGKPEAYGDDRVFVYLRDPASPDAQLDAGIEALSKAGHPTITLAVHGAADLGRVFFFAEFASAVAGWVLGINPFDQPNVQEAKDNTAKVLAAGDLPEVDPGDPVELFAQAQPPRYVAILAYVKPSAEFDAAIDEMRARIRDHTTATTTFGYGPRYLHSTGQYHKGGPPNGLFLELVDDGDEDVEIPEAGYGFRHLKNAQAIGDLLTLRDHGLPAVQIRLEGDPADAVRRLP